VERKIKVITIEDAAEQLLTTSEAVIAEIEAGRMKGFRIGGEWRTTEEALLAFIGEAGQSDLMVSSEGKDKSSTEGKETMTQMLSTMQGNWTSTGKFAYVWPGGPEDFEEGYSCTLRTGNRDVPITVAFTNRASAGKKDRRRAVVFWGIPGKSMLPVVEFAGANDYPDSHILASVIKHPGGKHARPGEVLPGGYESLKTGLYTDYIIGPSAARSIAVIAKDDDYTAMAKHAILRAYQKRWM
jgi:hypothetical protein